MQILLKAKITSIFTCVLIPAAEVKKSKSFASTLKKRFARPKKTRSQSADRAQSSSFREGSLLKPPDQQDSNRTTGQKVIWDQSDVKSSLWLESEDRRDTSVPKEKQFQM